MRRRFQSMCCVGVAVLVIGAQSEVHATEPTVSVWLHSSSVRVSTEPMSQVDILLLDKDEVLKATGASRAAPTGVATILLDTEIEGRGVAVEPGDELEIVVDGVTESAFTIPALRVDVSADDDRVFGTAPANSQVDLVLGGWLPEDGVAIGVLDVGDDGRFSHILQRAQSVGYSDYGHVRYVDPDGHEFKARYAVLGADFHVGKSAASVYGSFGTSVTLSMVLPGGGQFSESRVITAQTVESSSTAAEWRNLPPIEPGAEITVTKTSPGLQANQSLHAVVPELRTWIDRGANVVRGTGPAHARILVDVGNAAAVSGYRPAHAEEVEIGASGRFELAAKEGLVLERGWRAQAATTDGYLRFLSSYTIPVHQVALFGTNVRGITDEYAPVTVTLSSDIGQLLGQAVTETHSDGRYNVWFDPVSERPSEVFIESEMTLVIEEGAKSGDPTVIRVPNITIETDASLDTISGSAPNGATIRVADRSGRIVRRTSTTNEYYRLELGTGVDVRPGDSGPVVITTDSGIEYYSSWSAISISLTQSQSDELGNPSGYWAVKGKGARGRVVELVLLDKDEQLVSSRQLRIASTHSTIESMGAAAQWSATLETLTGEPGHVFPGDRLQVRVGDDDAVLTVPRLEASVDIAVDFVAGETEPRLTVFSQAVRSGVAGRSPVRSSSADSNGRFTVDYSGVFDLQYRDNIVVGASSVEGHTVTRYVRSPGLTIDLDNSTVAGVGVPGEPLLIQLLDEQGVRASEHVTVSRLGTFVTPVRHDSRQLVEMQPGKQIRVRGVTGQSKPIDMTIPELTLELSTTAGTAHGRATPGGHLLLEAEALFRRSGSQRTESYGYASVDVGSEGSYSVAASAFTDAIRLHPGLSILAQYRQPSGHLVITRRAVPILNAQIHGARLCGFGPADSLVDMTITTAGTETGRARGMTDRHGTFDLSVLSNTGDETAIQPGDTISARLGSAQVELVLPRFDVDVYWDDRTQTRGARVSKVSGSGPPLTQLYVDDPAGECLAGLSSRRTQLMRGGTDRFGTFTMVFDSQAPGNGAQLSFYDKSEHRVYYQIRKSLIRAHVGTDRVSGYLPALSTARILLRDASGQVVAESTVSSDSDGMYDSHMVAETGDPVHLQQSDRIELYADDGDTRMTVERLDIDFSEEDGLDVFTNPNEQIDAIIRLADSRQVAVQLTGDGNGRAGLREHDVPDREGWSLDDIRFARLSVSSENGHETVLEFSFGEDDAQDNERNFLPLVSRRH